MNSCATAEALEQLARGTLPEEHASRLGAHLASCAACRALLDSLSDRPALQSWTPAAPPAWSDTPDEPELAGLLSRLGAMPPSDIPESNGVAEPSDAPLHFLAPPKIEGDLGMLGPYRVLEELGRGGMGIVLRAYDEELRRPVALKVLPLERADARARARFVREARAAASVSHENVVPVYAVANPADGPPTLSCSTWKARRCGNAFRWRAGSSPDRPPRFASRQPRVWPPPTAPAWSIATSNRPTSASTPMGRRCWWILASPRNWTIPPARESPPPARAA